MLKLKSKVQQVSPLIHCITNGISVNDCANVILAIGGKPIMAEHPREVAEITQIAQALALNLGNISDSRMVAMQQSAKIAMQEHIPMILDLVGIGCSTLRREYAKDLITTYHPNILKGNMSELKAIGQVIGIGEIQSHAKGVDVGVIDQVTEENIKQSSNLIKALARTYECVVVATGAIDLISDGRKVYQVKNGSERLAQITGTGCMLNALIGTLISVGDCLTASLLGVLLMGISGEIACKVEGNGSYHVALLDALSKIEDLSLGNWEEIEEEKVRQPVEKVNLTLYLVTDSSGLKEDEFLYRVEEACKGGVTLVQLREKEKSTREYIELAQKIKVITDRYHIPLIIDDRVDIALAIEAAGVHLGQSDLSVEKARKLMGEDKIIGATAKTVEQALEAERQGANYLGVGAIYPTTTKVKTVLTPVSTLNDIGNKVNIPVVAIGGLNEENCQILKDSQAKGIAVVSALMKAANPQEAAYRLRKKIEHNFY